jgi:hypothetical protein
LVLPPTPNPPPPAAAAAPPPALLLLFLLLFVLPIIGNPARLPASSDGVWIRGSRTLGPACASLLPVLEWSFIVNFALLAAWPNLFNGRLPTFFFSWELIVQCFNKRNPRQHHSNDGVCRPLDHFSPRNACEWRVSVWAGWTHFCTDRTYQHRSLKFAGFEFHYHSIEFLNKICCVCVFVEIISLLILQASNKHKSAAQPTSRKHSPTHGA